ncbi:MAG: hypothetical protein IKO55_13120, partial [Kiritimatiellae bacterium]|nr:hypothetical protein [Kiritimatiellia bacterium]
MSDDTYAALQQHLVEHPDGGDLIPGSGGLRKIRWSDRNDLPGGPAERQALLKRANELRVEQKAEAARF